ncbi:hypothetical protein UFOVP75_39 [uncultured Caudovirales phage]|uniref:Uncharacterized protein n=1 Tax=uncultured Caudovirales phage TaxID=2100421 RepID=A0A6J5L4F2_9CAUD|nr:hypothetical protein UFOVP75_39 [uncultured Caudovirales phage]
MLTLCGCACTGLALWLWVLQAFDSLSREDWKELTRTVPWVVFNLIVFCAWIFT